MTAAILAHDPQLRSRVEQCLRDGWSVRDIEKELGISRMTVSRYARGSRREGPRPPVAESDERRAAKIALDVAFNHFDNYRDRVSYDAWVEAQRAYDALRGPRHAS